MEHSQDKMNAGAIKFRPNYHTAMNWMFTPSHQAAPVSTAPIEFPDVSFYQGNINWDTMSAQTRNIIIRAGQNTWRDEKFSVNWVNAKQRGMSRGCYWFYDGRASPNAQWDVLRPLLAGDLPEDVIWVDWERNYGGAYEGLRNVVSFMKLIEQGFPGCTVGMYTGYYWFIENSNGVNNAQEYSYLASKPLWEAWYGMPSDQILIPQPWNTHTIELHQYGTPSVGLEYGCESIELDMNRVLNNHDRYGGETDMPDNIIITPITPKWYKVTADLLNIRNTPYGAGDPSTDIGDLPLNSHVLADGTHSVSGVIWYHIIDANLPSNTPPNGADVICTDGRPVNQHTDCWVSSKYVVATNHPVEPPTQPPPPQEIIFTDSAGVKWKSTTFTKV